MLRKVFSIIGANIFGVQGSGIARSLSRYLGASFGGMVFDYISEMFDDEEETQKSKKIGRALNNLYVQSSCYGVNIPIIYGKVRLAGNIIWAKPFDEKIIEDDNKVTFIYHGTFAIGLSEGVIDKIERVWIGDQIIDISKFNFRLYKGSEDQLPDPDIQEHMKGNAPAYRGLAYIVFKDFPLSDFGNKIPNFNFEVTRRPLLLEEDSSKETNYKAMQSSIKSIVLIPGSGEFVYDTNIQEKLQIENNIVISKEYINSHNYDKISNVEYSLEQLLKACPNLEYISLVVCWYGDSLNIENCKIFPACEFNDKNSATTEEWQVAGFNRSNAKVISKDEFGNPNYGGTPTDQSVLRLIKYLKSKNLKIMLYPMLMLDTAGKPWRGHLTGDSKFIESFFVKQYNPFILHYASLCKGLIDSFVIGSEFKSLTSIRVENTFPAVTEFKKLAESVKSILVNTTLNNSTLEDRTIITYAADWSEYHSTSGYFNMDELWSSPAIDVIGIDAYFPLTDSSSFSISKEQIKAGWESGEGYNYYYSDNQKLELTPPYAWKNIKYWWENFHINPDGTKTTWQPRMKKIWFTEFGFPSINKSPNQPNIFYNPKALDGGIPKNSNGEIDFSIQKIAIEATLEYWQNSNIVERMFLWAYDARPYPAWPHYLKWTDHQLWAPGHYLNGKLDSIPLRDILMDLCIKSGITFSHVKFYHVEDSISGILLENQNSIGSFFQLLRSCFFFDTVITNDIITFIKRSIKPPYFLNAEDILIDESLQVASLQVEYISESQLLSKVQIFYINNQNSYIADFFSKSASVEGKIASMKLPFHIEPFEIKKFAEIIVKNGISENTIFTFKLPFKYIFIKVGDRLFFEFQNTKYFIKVCVIEIEGIVLKLEAVLDDVPCAI